MSELSSDLLAGAWFPGPRSENEAWVRAEFQAMLDRWFDWRKAMFVGDPGAAPPASRADARFLGERELLAQQLQVLTDALREEIPTYTPRYLGHMKAELSLPALFGWFAALLHNPNNTSREAAKVGTVIEAEALGMLAEMLGFDPARAQGHFTSGGTVANFEAVWRARYRLDHWLALALFVSETTGQPLDVFAAAHMGWERFRALRDAHAVDDQTLRRCSAVAGNPADVWRRISKASGRDYLGPVVLVPGNRHYSWRKAANVFGLGEESFWSVPLDAEGRLDVDAFAARVAEAEAAGRPVLMSVAVAGTTETGGFDPIDRLYDRLDAWKRERGWRIWRHVDAAYGGFLCALLGGEGEAVLSEPARRALAAVGRADSITIDPHKMGYVPYACGAFLAKDAACYAVAGFDAPYLDRPELGDGKWSSTLEGSRSAAGAAATWLTGKTMGFGPERFGALLAATVEARQGFQAAVAEALPQVRFLEPSDANIACFSVAAPGEALSRANARTAAVFEAIHRSPDFSVSKTTLGPDYAAQKAAHLARYGGVDDAEGLLVVRCVFMNPYWGAAEVRAALVPELVAALRAAGCEGDPAAAARKAAA